MAGIVENKSIVITGAGRGIGAAIAQDLAAEGGHVVVADLDLAAAETVAAEIRSAGGRAVASGVDVANRDSVNALAAAAVTAHGSLDIWFNNAGVAGVSPILEIEPAEWDRILNVNARGVLFGLQAAGRQFIAQGGGGKIINTASVVGKQPMALFAHYSASKAAVIALTQSASRELGRHGITVNAFAPGGVDTELSRNTFRQQAEKNLAPSLPQGDELFSAVALGRFSTPADLVGIARFLASPASDYITGQTISVDGGMAF